MNDESQSDIESLQDLMRQRMNQEIVNKLKSANKNNAKTPIKKKAGPKLNQEEVDALKLQV